MNITLDDILNTPAIQEKIIGLIPVLDASKVLNRISENGVISYNDVYE